MAIEDLPAGIGQVLSSIRFEVWSRAGEKVGEIQPERTRSGLKVTVNTTARVTRQLKGLTLRADEAADINPYADLVKPLWVWEDGTERPQGTFIWSQPDRYVDSWETPLTATLFDLSYQLDQESLQAVSLPARGKVYPAMLEVAALAGFDENDHEIQPNDATVLDAVAWPAGSSYKKILSELAEMAGYLAPYFDNEGTLILRPFPEIKLTEETIRYPLGPESRVLKGTVVVPEALSTPGAHQVINTGTPKGDITAVAYVDPDLPWSRERRGFLIAKTHRVQGVESTAEAEIMAQSFIDQSPEAAVTFGSAPDPRHDIYNLVEFDGTVYLETGWSLTLGPGGPMTHQLSSGGEQTS